VKVLVADQFEAAGRERLAAAGCVVHYRPDLNKDTLPGALAEAHAEVLIVRGTPVTAAALQEEALALVVRAGAGYNTIDVDEASRRGIYVSNCPGQNAAAVAELAFGLMLALDRRIPDNVADLRAGRWNKKEYSKARGLLGRTLGLLGYGHIGREMARRARAFGMRTVVWSRRLATAAESVAGEVDGIQIRRSPDQVADESDILSVHLALEPATRDFVDWSMLERLKPGAMFINTARAEVVNQAALERAIRDRGLRVGLDVFSIEPAASASSPAPFTDPIGRLPAVYGTHHIGASTEQAQEAIAEEAVRIVLGFKNTGKAAHVVNLAAKSPATHTLVVRHRDRPGVLAHVLDQLRREAVNVQEMENVVFDGAEAAVARINLDAPPADALLRAIRLDNRDILDLRVVKIESR
jgi:D-3-phosphoglycerate dehydrogenase